MSGVFVKILDKDALLNGLGGAIISSNFLGNLILESVCTDSRVAEENSLFFACKGSTKNGHDYILDAIKNGSKCVVLEEITPEIKDAFDKHQISWILVDDSVFAIQKLARYKRSKMANARFVAITGSAGKTTVKSMVAQTLERSFVVSYSQKSYNNHIGVPLTILNADPKSHIVVVEVGTNRKGEIEFLSEIVKPDIAIITMIGSSHIGNFEDGIDGIIKEKASISKHLNANGFIILNEENEHFKKVYDEVRANGVKNIVRIGKVGQSHLYLGEFKLTNYCTTDYKVIMRDSTGLTEIKCHLNGIAHHNAFNTLFVFAIARLFKNVKMDSVAQMLSRSSVVEGRGNIEYLFVDKKKIMVINDAYNCSYDALRSSINTMGAFKKQYPDRRVVCFLGDMKEIGDRSTEYHISVKDPIISNMIDKVYTVGEGMKNLHDVLPDSIRGQHFKHVGALTKHIRSFIEDKDICLFKGANSMSMSTAIEKLYRV